MAGDTVQHEATWLERLAALGQTSAIVIDPSVFEDPEFMAGLQDQTAPGVLAGFLSRLGIVKPEEIERVELILEDFDDNRIEKEGSLDEAERAQIYMDRAEDHVPLGSDFDRAFGIFTDVQKKFEPEDPEMRDDVRELVQAAADLGAYSIEYSRVLFGETPPETEL